VGVLGAVLHGLAAASLGLIPSPGGSLPALQFGVIQYDSPGSPDTGTNRSLNGEYASVRNTSSRAIQLRGMTVRDVANHIYVFPSMSLGAGRTVRIHTGRGTNTASDVYWRQNNYVWNNDGDTATLRNAAGTRLDTCRSTSTGTGKIACP
jgi:Lamin Tail Domain